MSNWLWKKKPSSGQAPAFWEVYQAKFKQGLDRRRLIEDTSFVVFDTETTGLDVKTDRILSIGAVRVRCWQLDLRDSLDILVHQPDQRLGAQSIPIHGLLPVAREGSLREEDAVETFVRYIGDDLLVGHHVVFDMAMVNQALGRMGLGKLRNSYLDTARLAQRLQGRYNSEHVQGRGWGLDDLCRQYGIAPADRHTAAGDTYLTAILLMKLLARLKKRQVRNLGDLLR